MEKSWVMSEEERLQLLRTRLQRKQAEQKNTGHNSGHNLPHKPSAPNSPLSAYVPDYAYVHQHLQPSEVRIDLLKLLFDQIN